MGTWYISFKGVCMRNLQYEMRICQKVIIKSQRQFMYGSNFYESDVNTIMCCANRCVLERDPIAQKHLAKIQTMRGTYDAMGNRLPPPNPSEGAPARRSKSSSNLSKSHPIIIVFLSQKLTKNVYHIIPCV